MGRTMTLLRSLYYFARRLLYRYYLHSPRWQQKRVAVLSRAGYRCEQCGRAVSLDVHHLTYRHIYRERLGELRALCRECHKKEHKGW